MISASIIFVPSLLGYIGATRRSKIILFLVSIKTSGLTFKIFPYIIFLYFQYLFPLIILWTCEFVLLIIFPGVKSFVKTTIEDILLSSLSIYRYVAIYFIMYLSIHDNIDNNIPTMTHDLLQRKIWGATLGESNMGPHYGSVALLWCQIFHGFHKHYIVDEYKRQHAGIL